MRKNLAVVLRYANLGRRYTPMWPLLRPRPFWSAGAPRPEGAKIRYKSSLGIERPSYFGFKSFCIDNFEFRGQLTARGLVSSFALHKFEPHLLTRKVASPIWGPWSGGAKTSTIPLLGFLAKRKKKLLKRVLARVAGNLAAWGCAAWRLYGRLTFGRGAVSHTSLNKINSLTVIETWPAARLGALSGQVRGGSPLYLQSTELGSDEIANLAVDLQNSF